MAISAERLGDRIGILKILTIAIGIITLGFIADSYYKDGRDEAFLSCVIICLIISFLWALAIILDVIHQSEGLKKAELLYHSVAFVFYVVTLICFIVSLIDHRTGKFTTKHKLWQRVVAFILGVIMTGLYGFTSFLLYKALG